MLLLFFTNNQNNFIFHLNLLNNRVLKELPVEHEHIETNRLVKMQNSSSKKNNLMMNLN